MKRYNCNGNGGRLYLFSIQEMAKTAQARKGIQTSPDGELASIFFKETQRDSALIIVTVTVGDSGQDCASLRTLNEWAFAKFCN